MTKARKCDRCGDFYLEPGGRVTEKYEQGVVLYKNRYDLCGTCLKEFKHWFSTVIRAAER